ncbi:hypothetical protein THSYN_12160 [Candidatus Thiodictyon syntrophicum]|uniref:Uncharacterized protein n=1 Tax=Candidatus Thiodictyon syntrophicum TaxID=1166950 RepID=A0A2K8U8A5_9GAMM|nr:hypothetical protein THSYN_12160 [Candidatus Thiodictyon syntrophicum]
MLVHVEVQGEPEAAFYGPLQGLEVALRNAMHGQLTGLKGLRGNATESWSRPRRRCVARASDLASRSPRPTRSRLQPDGAPIAR